MHVTEEEIVADCSDMLSQLAGLDGSEQELETVESASLPAFGQPSTIERFFEEELASGECGEGDGEHRAVELAGLARKVAALRRNHFDLAKRIQSPRFFLLPATDMEGEILCTTATNQGWLTKKMCFDCSKFLIYEFIP